MKEGEEKEGRRRYFSLLLINIKHISFYLSLTKNPIQVYIPKLIKTIRELE